SLTAGAYTVTVTDNNGCTRTASATITQPAVLTANITASTNILCNGATTGSATVTAGGGVAPYTYSWSPSGGTAATASGLAAGAYTVTVTGVGGCTATASVTLTQPAALTSSITASTNISCNGGNNGSATVTAGGGSAPYTYSWSPSGGTAATASGLTAGAYTVTVTDNNGCTRTSSVTLTQPAALTATMGAPTNVTCNGGNNGAVSVTVGGGSVPYSYNWSPAPGAGQGTAAISSLTAGAYTVTVTDNNGCTQTASATITQPALLTATISSSTNVTCNGLSNGSATVNAGGGVAPYTYSWSPSGGTGLTASNLAAGNYSVTVTDNNGCASIANITITQPTVITLATSSVNTNCGAATGSVDVVAGGGAGGYSYSWNTAPVQTTATATNLASGNYTVTVTDASGCTATATQAVNNNAAPTIAEVVGSHIDVNCFGGSTGAAEVTVAGGQAPLVISWSPSGGSAATASGLAAGTYTVTVTDDNNCQASVNIIIAQPAALVANASVLTNVSCNGGTNGSVTVLASGGTGALGYSWNSVPVQTTATATNLPAGPYTVTITDANGCTITASATVTQPAVLTAISGAPGNITCLGANNGTASVVAGGGTLPYSYNWSPAPGGGQGTASVTGLSAGAYTVT
ncbi:MAG TPA: SprB repeat-containing protein, partial [Flavobacteriales bacterium]|nr:SprB repeat-containing protein [Flavobacteriales bacterium]